MIVQGCNTKMRMSAFTKVEMSLCALDCPPFGGLWRDGGSVLRESVGDEAGAGHSAGARGAARASAGRGAVGVGQISGVASLSVSVWSFPIFSFTRPSIRVVALIGPRQSGKTTAARQIVSADSAHYFDLEDPASLARLSEPMVALAGLRGVVVIDEIQRRPDLFPILRVLADRKPLPARFLILGSASPELLRQSSESLAGRVEVITLQLTPSMRVALGDLKLEHLTILYPGSRRYALAARVTVVPLGALAAGDPSLVFATQPL